MNKYIMLREHLAYNCYPSQVRLLDLCWGIVEKSVDRLDENDWRVIEHLHLHVFLEAPDPEEFYIYTR